MNLVKFRIGVLLVIVVLLSLTACGDSGDKSSEPTAPPATKAPAPTKAAEPTKAGEPTQAPEPTEPSAPIEEPESEIPFDIPIMEEATNLDVQKTTLSYLMESTVMDDVVEFYKTEMVERGWSVLAESEIGLMVNVNFETDEAKVTIQLQANEIAKTVKVQIRIMEK